MGLTDFTVIISYHWSPCSIHWTGNTSGTSLLVSSHFSSREFLAGDQIVHLLLWRLQTPPKWNINRQLALITWLAASLVSVSTGNYTSSLIPLDTAQVTSGWNCFLAENC